MPAGDIYMAWANATPTTPFPFTYQDKKVGKIQQSWADVRNGIQRDAISTALPFCTSHITPTIVQVNIIADSIKKENLSQQRWERESVARSRGRLTQSAMGEASDPNTPNTSERPQSSLLRRSLRTAQEQDALVNSEGGRGRAAYLKMRRALNPQQRYDGRPRTMAQNYGWNVDRSRDADEEFRSISSALSATHGSLQSTTTTAGNDVAATPSASQRGAKLSAHITQPEKNLSDALAMERRCLDEGIATGLIVTGKRPDPCGDFRRKSTMIRSRRASGVFPVKE